MLLTLVLLVLALLFLLNTVAQDRKLLLALIARVIVLPLLIIKIEKWRRPRTV